MDDFRPIAVTSVLFKLLEVVVFNWLKSQATPFVLFTHRRLAFNLGLAARLIYLSCWLKLDLHTRTGRQATKTGSLPQSSSTSVVHSTHVRIACFSETNLNKPVFLLRLLTLYSFYTHRCALPNLHLLRMQLKSSEVFCREVFSHLVFSTGTLTTWRVCLNAKATTSFITQMIQLPQHTVSPELSVWSLSSAPGTSGI